MGQALAQDGTVVWCYCCEDFTHHEVFPSETPDDPTYYQCDCGCMLDDSEDEIIYPDNENRSNIGHPC